MAEQLKLALRPGPFVRREIPAPIVRKKEECAECGELTEELFICRRCQEVGEWCR